MTSPFCFPELPHFIRKPPPSVTIEEKQNVTLHCKAAGFPPPIITWYKDGRAIEEEKTQFQKRKLELKEIQFEHRGIYTCTAENLLGRVQLSVNITVKGKYLGYESLKTCHLIILLRGLRTLLILVCYQLVLASFFDRGKQFL